MTEQKYKEAKKKYVFLTRCFEPMEFYLKVYKAFSHFEKKARFPNLLQHGIESMFDSRINSWIEHILWNIDSDPNAGKFLRNYVCCHIIYEARKELFRRGKNYLVVSWNLDPEPLELLQTVEGVLKDQTLQDFQVSPIPNECGVIDSYLKDAFQRLHDDNEYLTTKTFSYDNFTDRLHAVFRSVISRVGYDFGYEIDWMRKRRDTTRRRADIIEMVSDFIRPRLLPKI